MSCTSVPYDILDPKHSMVQRAHGLVPMKPGHSLHILPVAGVLNDLLQARVKGVLVHFRQVQDQSATSLPQAQQVVKLIEK